MTRSERRKAMPECTRFVDELRKDFPDLRILYANEAGFTWGEEQESGVPVSEMYQSKAGHWFS